jgi:hypothetical protein
LLVAAIENFAPHNNPLILFEKGQPEGDRAKPQRKQSHKSEGVVFTGKAQEECRVYGTEKPRYPKNPSPHLRWHHRVGLIYS